MTDAEAAAQKVDIFASCVFHLYIPLSAPPRTAVFPSVLGERGESHQKWDICSGQQRGQRSLLVGVSHCSSSSHGSHLSPSFPSFASDGRLMVPPPSASAEGLPAGVEILRRRKEDREWPFVGERRRNWHTSHSHTGVILKRGGEH